MPNSGPVPFPRFPLIPSLPAPRQTADMEMMKVVMWKNDGMDGAGVVMTTAVRVVAVVVNAVAVVVGAIVVVHVAAAVYLACFLAFLAAFFSWFFIVFDFTKTAQATTVDEPVAG